MKKKKLLPLLFLLICTCFTLSAQVKSLKIITGDPSLHISQDQFDLGNVSPGGSSQGDEADFKITEYGGYNCWDVVKSDQEFFASVKSGGSEIGQLFCLNDIEIADIVVIITYPDSPGFFEKFLYFKDHDNPNFYYEVKYTGTVVSGDDTELPTVPTNLHAISTTKTEITVGWTASTDNNAMNGYLVYVNGNYYGFTSSTQKTISGLNSNTTYNIQVIAQDVASNESLPTAVNITTLPEPFYISIFGPSTGDNTGWYTWSPRVYAGDIGTPPYTYLWQYHPDFYSHWSTFGTTQYLYSQMPVDSDLFLKLTVTDSNGEVRDYEKHIINTDLFFKPKSASISSSEENLNIEKFDNIIVYPNPVKEKLVVGLPEITENTYIYLYSLTGELLFSKKATKTIESIDFSQQPSGIYIIKVNGNEQIFTQKITKN